MPSSVTSQHHERSNIRKFGQLKEESDMRSINMKRKGPRVACSAIDDSGKDGVWQHLIKMHCV